MMIKRHQGPVPEHVKTVTPEQFMAPTSFGDLGDGDLFWILYRAASETAAAGDFGPFYTKVNTLLAERLGAGKFGIYLIISPNSHGGYYAFNSVHLGKHQVTGADPGVLPGIGAANAVDCLVWWI